MGASTGRDGLRALQFHLHARTPDSGRNGSGCFQITGVLAEVPREGVKGPGHEISQPRGAHENSETLRSVCRVRETLRSQRLEDDCRACRMEDNGVAKDRPW